MSGLTRTQLESWRPDDLASVAKMWRSAGSRIEGLFNRYVSSVENVNGEYWSGDAAEAAHSRAIADRKTAVSMVDKLESLATDAETASHEIAGCVRTARDHIAGAEAAMFRVSDSFIVTDVLAGPDPDRAAVMSTWQTAITEAAIAAFNADLTAQQKLAGQRAGLIATFTDSASLGGEKGSEDGRALAEHPDKLSESAERRLIEAGRLTPEQLAALRDGDPNTPVRISASQMEYINSVNRSLDGKSPQEIRDIVNKMPPEGRAAFANMQQIGSNKEVTATVVGDKDVPTHGGLGVLPESVQKSLTRSDLVRKASTHSAGYAGSAVSHAEFNLNGVADNKAIAEIVGAGGDQYKAGSDLDNGLMKVGQTYLHAQVMAEQADGGVITVDGKGAETSSPVTEGIFSSISADKSAVDVAVNDPHTGMQFVDDVLTHKWSDDGRSVGGLFEFGPDRVSATDPHSAPIMSAVARAFEDDSARKLFASIPGDETHSVGDVNPQLLRTVSHSMAPYITDLAGGDAHPEFRSLGTNERTLPNLIAALNTDHDAGVHFNSQAMDARMAQLAQFGHDPKGATEAAMIAGRIAGATDVGNYWAQQDKFGEDAAQAAYARKVESFQMVKSLALLGADKIPHVGDLAAAADATPASKALMDLVIGGAPTPKEFESDGNLTHLSGEDLDSAYYAILRGAGPLPPDVVEMSRGLVDPSTGVIRDFDQLPIVENNAKVTSALQDMYARLVAGGGESQAYANAYRKARSLVQ